MMTTCRVCLCNNARKDITQLKSTQNECGYAQIMLFCLNIQISEDSDETTKLCTKCFKKIIDFYNFKSLAIKNDSYLRSLNSQIVKEEQFNTDEEFDIKEDNSLDASVGLRSDSLSYIAESNVALEYKVKDECTQDDHLLLADEDSFHADESIVYEYVEETKKLQTQKKKKIAKPIEPSKKKPSKKRKYPYLQEPGMCPVCGKQVRNLQEHSFTHLPSESRPKYKCGSCNKVYVSLSGRSQHIRRKHRNVKKQCHICNAMVIHIKPHMRAVHDPNSRQNACPFCDRKFLSQWAVNVHVAQYHTGERAFPCNSCDMKFKTSSMLKKHTRRIHEKEKKYQCDHCSKCFFLKERLVKHLRLHTNEKPYKCPDCDRRFVSSESLRGHRYTHNSSKQRCTLCDKTFTKPAYLRAHLLSHTKEKIYQCQYCAAAFHRSDHRKRHEYNSHVKLGRV